MFNSVLTDIRKQRLDFQLQTEKKVMDTVEGCLEEMMKPDNSTDENSTEIQSDNNQGKEKKSDLLLQIVLFLSLLAYCFLIGFVIRYVFSLKSAVAVESHYCNNACILLIAVLLLATVVLVLLGRFYINMRRLAIEEQKENNKNRPKENKKDPSFKDQVSKDIQQAVLKMIANDYIESFNKRK